MQCEGIKRACGVKGSEGQWCELALSELSNIFRGPMLPTEMPASEDEGFINNWIEVTADIQNQNDVQEWCMAGCGDVQA